MNGERNKDKDGTLSGNGGLENERLKRNWTMSGSEWEQNETRTMMGREW